MLPPLDISPPPNLNNPEKALTLALTLAQAEQAIHVFSSRQVDAIVDIDGNAYLLRPAQEHLRQSERWLQAMIDSAADVITVVDRGGRVVSQSGAVTRVLGYEPDELIGLSLFELIYEESLNGLYTAFFDVIEGLQESATVQFYHSVRGGSYRLIEATVGRLRDVSSLFAVFIFRPVGRPLPGQIESTVQVRLSLVETMEEPNGMILSHGQRIPFMGTPLGTHPSEPTPS